MAETMLEFFDGGRPGPRYWGSFAIVLGGNILDYYDFFIVGFLMASVGPVWHLTYGQASLILLAGGVGSILGSLFFGAMADKFGRRLMLIIATMVCALSAGSIALVPDGAWQIFALIRVLVGIGLGGIASVQIPLLTELTPTPYRVKVMGFPSLGNSTGVLLAAFTTATLITLIGWRGVALFGLAPLVLCVAIISIMPESPRWLITNKESGRARAAIAALLKCPVGIVPDATGDFVRPPKVSLFEVYSRPGRFWLIVILWACLATCNYGVYLWGPTITSLLMHISVAKAAKYFVYISMVGITGRLAFAIIPNFLGRRGAGKLFGYCIALTFAIAAFLYHDFYAGVSIFIVMLAINAFFNDGAFASLTPYTAEVFPVRLGARGFGVAQAANGVGKIAGPYVLALIAGTHKVVSEQATEAAIIPVFLFLAACGAVVGICHSFAPETVGRALVLDDQPAI